jgi:AbrB family looped-hinge helix DNA binding protein
MGKTAKVTSKGQVTIPKEIRDYLSSRIVEFEIENGRVIVRPVKSVAAVLKKYANPDLIPKEATAWRSSVADKHEDR